MKSRVLLLFFLLIFSTGFSQIAFQQVLPLNEYEVYSDFYSAEATFWYDFDYDGDVEVILFGQETAYFENENGHFKRDWSKSFKVSTGLNSSYLEHYCDGDLNNDGFMDFLLVSDVDEGSGCDSLYVYLNDGQGNFSEMHIDNVALPFSYTHVVSLVDHDFDGDLDLWLRSGGGIDCYNDKVLLNDGDGNFPAYEALPWGVSSAIVGEADFDGDGDLDRMRREVPDSDGQWLVEENLNDTAFDINYTSANLSGLSGRLWNYGDVNADGHLDIVSLADAGNHLEIITYRNNGNMSFLENDTEVIDDANQIRQPGVVLADFNGDGFDDLMVTGFHHAGSASALAVKGLYLYLNDGDGYFHDDERIRLTDRNMGELKAMDINADGHMDFVVKDAFGRVDYTAYIPLMYLHDGNLNFTPSFDTPFIEVGDYHTTMDADGDGTTDLVFDYGFQVSNIPNPYFPRVHFNNDSVFMQIQTLLPYYEEVGTGNEHIIKYTDFDLDGLLDGFGYRITYGTGWQEDTWEYFIFRQTGPFEFQRFPFPISEDYTISSSSYMILTDINGDDYPDVFLRLENINTWEREHQVWINNLDGTFTQSGQFVDDIPSDTDVQGVESGDFNGDGLTDFIIVSDGIFSGDSEISVYIQNAEGDFVETEIGLPDQFDRPNPVVADLDSDEDLDIFLFPLEFISWSNGEPLELNPPQLYLNDGTGSFTLSDYEFPYDTTYVKPVFPEDMNNDGHLDLITAGNYKAEDLAAAGHPTDHYQSIIIFLNDGTGHFDEELWIRGETYFGSPLHVLDFDQNNLPDLLHGKDLLRNVSCFDDVDSDGDGVCDGAEIVGCQDPDASNYNPDATDPGPCEYDWTWPGEEVDVYMEDSDDEWSGRPEFSIYPNPIKEGALIVSFANPESRSFRVFDLLGRLVFEGQANSEILRIPREKFPSPGIYSLVVPNAGCDLILVQ